MHAYVLANHCRHSVLLDWSLSRQAAKVGGHAQAPQEHRRVWVLASLLLLASFVPHTYALVQIQPGPTAANELQAALLNPDEPVIVIEGNLLLPYLDVHFEKSREEGGGQGRDEDKEGHSIITCFLCGCGSCRISNMDSYAPDLDLMWLEMEMRSVEITPCQCAILTQACLRR